MTGYDNAQTLIDGFTFGFPIPSSKDTSSATPPRNHNSALSQPNEVQKKLRAELDAGRISGPFQTPPFTNFVSSPLGLVPKSDGVSFRLIHDLSYPPKDSVNSHIDPTLTSVNYETLDHCVAIAQRIGRNALIAKADIQDAFRLLPIHPVSYNLLGFTWDGAFYYDKCLPMGCSVSCQLFEAFATSIQWILTQKLNVPFISHILDDFIFFGPSSSNTCYNSLQSFLLLSQSLRIPVKESKTVLPSTSVQLHGITLDTEQMCLILPPDKVETAIRKLEEVRHRKKVTLQQLQSLIGTLSFACKAIPPGRAFLRRLHDLTCKVKRRNHLIYINREARQDISVWQRFLADFNGRVLCLPESWENSDTIRMYSDASKHAMAAVLHSSWIQEHFPSSWDDVNIATKEFLPILLAVKVWAPVLKNRRILFFTDNEAVVYIINNQTTRDKHLMGCVRDFVLTTLVNNILFKAKHIPGVKNVVPDLLSRSQVDKAKGVAPWLDETKTELHQNWLPW